MSKNVLRGGVQLPPGYIFEFDPTGITNAPDLSTADKVHDYFGYGTWEAYGAGRTTIGVNSGHAIGSEGGEESHKLTTDEMPKHTHDTAKGEMLEKSGTQMDRYQTYQSESGITPGKYWYATTLPSGSSQPHNNMQPYRTVYRWRRIA